MEPVISKNFGLKGGTLDATVHVERVLETLPFEEQITYDTCWRCGQRKPEPTKPPS